VLTLTTTLDTMKALALAGAGPFASLATNLQKYAPDIVSAVHLHEVTIRGDLNEKKIRAGSNPSHFLPLPPPPPRANLIAACFRPTFMNDHGECDIEVALVGPRIFQSFGIRFERGRDGDADTHSYCHVQLTKDFVRKPIKCRTRLPPRMPQSYPALPTRCRNAGDTWLAVLVSVFGFSASDKAGLKRMLSDKRVADLCDNPESVTLLLNQATTVFHV
jgi:hypothetical protein